MKNGKPGVCIIGCGDMGTRHALAWQRSSAGEVVVVASLTESRARLLAEKLGDVRWSLDYHEAIMTPEVDVVSVCIPTNLHPEVSIFALSQGKHVLCEKPIALTLADAAAMRKAAQANGVKLGVGCMRRYSPVMRALHQALHSGELGGPVLFHSMDVREIRPKRMMHDVDMTGGAIVDMGAHIYDTWNYLFDSQPVQVFAQGLKLAKDRPELSSIDRLAYDSAAVTVNYASGDIGSFVITWGLPPKINPPVAPDQIFAPRGLAQVDWSLERQALRLWQDGNGWKTVETCDADMYRLQVENFARCIEEDRKPLVSAEDGEKSLRVALAALESIQTGKVVPL